MLDYEALGMKGQTVYTVDGKRLKAIRAQRRLTQHAVERQAGLAPNLVGPLERDGGNPLIDTLWRIAAVLNVSPTSLVKKDT